MPIRRHRVYCIFHDIKFTIELVQLMSYCVTLYFTIKCLNFNLIFIIQNNTFYHHKYERIFIFSFVSILAGDNVCIVRKIKLARTPKILATPTMRHVSLSVAKFLIGKPDRRPWGFNF